MRNLWHAVFDFGDGSAAETITSCTMLGMSTNQQRAALGLIAGLIAASHR